MDRKFPDENTDMNESAHSGPEPHDREGDHRAAWEAVRAGNPAADADIDLAALRAKVDAQVDYQATAQVEYEAPSRADMADPAEAEQETHSQFFDAEASDATVTPLAHAEIRRVRQPRRNWITAAAVAASVLVAGGGGYAIGALGPQDLDGTADVAAQEGQVPYFGDAATGRQSGAAADGAEIASDEARPASVPEAQSFAASADSAASMPTSDGSNTTDVRTEAWNNARFRFTDGGLSNARTVAMGWGFDVASIATEQMAQHAADVFGMEGDVKSNEWGWSVTSGGDNEHLNLSTSGNVSYYNNTVYSENSSKSKPMSTKKMQRVVLDYMSEFGIDAADVVFNSNNDGYEDESNFRWVSASVNIGGAVTESSWSATFVGETLGDINGDIAPVVELGEYEVISPAEALTRLNDPTSSWGRWPTTYPTWLEAQWNSGDMRMYSGATEVPPTPTAGAKLSMPVADVALSEASLGLSTYYDPSGARLLLPTYELGDGTGATWRVLAVTDDYIDTTVG